MKVLKMSFGLVGGLMMGGTAMATPGRGVTPSYKVVSSATNIETTIEDEDGHDKLGLIHRFDGGDGVAHNTVTARHLHFRVRKRLTTGRAQ